MSGNAASAVCDQHVARFRTACVIFILLAAIAFSGFVIMLGIHFTQRRPLQKDAKSEVYLVKTALDTGTVSGTSVALGEAATVARALGGTVATADQLKAALDAGASWCTAGILADGTVAFPVSASDFQAGIRVDAAGTRTYTCGTAAGVNTAPAAAGVLVYGPKPIEGTTNFPVVGFSGRKFSMFE